jgi:outer membrane protein TolC
LQSSHAIAKGTYITSNSVIPLQEKNISIAEKNASIALERYKQGAMSNYDFRITAQSVFDARSTLTQAKFEKAVSALELMLLTGSLNELMK